MSYLLFLILLIAFGAALFLGVLYILSKTGRSAVKVRSGAFIGVLLVMIVTHGMAPRLYVVTGSSGVLQVEEKVTLWGASYNTKNGKKLNFGIGIGSCGVVNDSDVLIAVEPIVYGEVAFADYSTYVLKQDGYTTCWSPRIDLMPHETPDETIEVSNSKDGEVVYWIHEYFDEADHEED